MAIDGKYRLILNYPSSRMKVILELATDGAKLSGKIWGGGLTAAPLEDGKVDGQQISWNVTQTMFPFSCVASIDGDQIQGEADFGFLGMAWMRGSRMDPATGKSSIDDEPAIAWKDKGLPRYEFASVEWVKAFGEWIGARFEGQTLDFDYRWSIELTDPPKHLLRDDGRSSIGWHYIVKDGKFTFGDGPLEGNLDFGGHAIPYASQVKRMRLTTDQLVEQQERNPPPGPLPGEKQTRLDQTEEFRYKMKRMNELISGPGNVMREEFWSQRTL